MAEVAGEATQSDLPLVHLFEPEGSPEEGVGGVEKMFEIGDLLGEGGFGQVRRAKVRNSGLEVALKSIPKSNREPGLREKFGSELLRRGLEELKHDNIIRFFAFGEDLHCSYAAMELLTGPELSEYFGECVPLPGPEAADVMSQAVAAIAFLHTHEVLHRDVKPENFMFSTPALATLKLIDFGSLVAGTMHLEDEAVGTVGFCAPECLRQPGECRQESDVFSLGVMLSIALTGAWPAPMRPHIWQPSLESGSDPATVDSYKEGLQGLHEPGALTRWAAKRLPRQETLAAILVKMLEPNPDFRVGAAEVQCVLTMCEIADATFTS